MRDNFFFTLGADGETAVPCEFEQWVKDQMPQVLYTETPIGYVSTVFLGLNISNATPPRIWETMAFSRHGRSEMQKRTATKAEALQVHEKFVKEQHAAADV